MNPFLPLNEYIPDGEAHVFGSRVYLYGSHDAAGSKRFCIDDYVGEASLKSEDGIIEIEVLKGKCDIYSFTLR